MLVNLSAKAQAQLVHAITQDTGDSIYAKDVEGRFTFVNPAALDTLGVKSPVGVIGHTTIEVIADKEAARCVMQNDRRVLQTGEAAVFEELVPARDGSPRWWSVRKTPMRDASGRLVGLLGIARDVTERKRHEEEREALARQWKVALDAARLGWWRYEFGSHTLSYDTRFARIFGLRSPEGTGRDVMRLVHPDDVFSIRDTVRDALHSPQGASFNVQFRVRREDGAELWIDAHGMALPNPRRGAPRRLIGTAADISTRKAMEQALRETNAQLQDADRQKDEFIATLAHELRNPLAPLRTIVEVLRARDDDPLIARVRPAMERQISHLARLVEDLLDVSRITRGVIHLHQQVLSLGEIAQTSAEPLRAALAAANVQLQVNVEPGPVLVLGDETRLAQCVTNLLSNALKFTPPGGIVNLGVRREGALAVLEVRDTGAGIAPASLERIFQLFVQDQPSGLRGNAGLGIGLALTRKLVELHGGTIRAFSRGPGLGSKFRVELPLAAQAAPARRPPQGPEALAATGASVLVVDDNQDAADSLREMLAMSGYRARSAYTGQGALDAIASEAPDLALLDIGLPDIDGYEVCRRVRAHAHGGRPALIALTGWGQERDKERAIAAGFNGHITKPADPRTLLAMVRQLTTT